jgi:hypothetical protein
MLVTLKSPTNFFFEVYGNFTQTLGPRDEETDETPLGILMNWPRRHRQEAVSPHLSDTVKILRNTLPNTIVTP